ncbi:MAG: hypothetical protein JWP63_1033 [Candidatus Solibacter sp.]|nr:hypothetical protein [Candidatus Solibacter sp.]
MERASVRRTSSAPSATTWRVRPPLRITRYPNITEDQFYGCVAAFVDSLEGELNAATAALRRLTGRNKGGAFAFEMALDQHRYGALIVIDRWSTLLNAFGPHLMLPRRRDILDRGPERARSAEEILARTNALVDSAPAYSEDVVEASIVAYQTVNGVFTEERAEAEQSAKLGPMLPEDYRDARRIFLEDLAAR